MVCNFTRNFNAHKSIIIIDMKIADVTSQKPQMNDDQSLVRQAMIQVAQLPDDDLVILIDFLHQLKIKRINPTNRKLAQQIVAEAFNQAEVLQGLSSSEKAARLNENLAKLSADAIAKGASIEGEWHGD